MRKFIYLLLALALLFCFSGTVLASGEEEAPGGEYAGNTADALENEIPAGGSEEPGEMHPAQEYSAASEPEAQPAGEDNPGTGESSGEAVEGAEPASQQPAVKLKPTTQLNL